MDASQIGIVATSLSIAKDIGKAMIGIRDSNLIAEKISALNEQLLKAQDALLAHNAAMFQLQNENFEAREQLRKLKETLSERGRYTLVDIGRGFLAYRVNLTPAERGASKPAGAEAEHYVCQSCFDSGRKSVLQPDFAIAGRSGWKCTACSTRFFSGV